MRVQDQEWRKMFSTCEQGQQVLRIACFKSTKASTLNHTFKKPFSTKKPPTFVEGFSDPDETRTRDPKRDRLVF